MRVRSRLATIDLEETDLELGAALGVSVPTIKKMWASIYRRVATTARKSSPKTRILQ